MRPAPVSTREGERVVLAASMAVFGAMAASTGADVVVEWPRAALGSKVYAAIALGGGVAAIFLGGWSWLRRTRVRLAGASVLGLLCVNQAAGLVGGTILCYSPG